MTIDTVLAEGAPGVVAILRGVRPDECVAMGAALVDAGIRLIEVPLNSPQPFDSIARLVKAFGDRALIGAGTVLSADEAAAVADAGGRLVVSPNTDASVIQKALERGLEPMPGFFSPTEAFTAVAAGAAHLKLFPARTGTPDHLTALREVLPRHVKLWAVGGVSAANMGEWLAKGAAGVGIGGSLYRAGTTPDELRTRARDLVSAWNTCKQT